MHGARLRTLTAFHHPRHAIAAGAPEAAPLPAGVRIVNAAVKALGEETDRVGDAQHHHLPVLEGNKAVIEVGGGDRDVLAEADRIVMIDPGVVARLGAGVFEALKARPGILVIGEAFRTVIACRTRSVERILAFAAIETD